MFFKNELPLDHELSLDYMAQAWATANVEDDNYTSNWNHEYERAWSVLEQDLEYEGLKMTTEWWDRGRT